jgi:hypothetical protein
VIQFYGSFKNRRPTALKNDINKTGHLESITVYPQSDSYPVTWGQAEYFYTSFESDAPIRIQPIFGSKFDDDFNDFLNPKKEEDPKEKTMTAFGNKFTASILKK